MKTKFHPILFSTPMVQAILEGRKTQTRRIVKDDMLQNPPADADFEFIKMTVINKYQVGDIFWVRETFYECEATELKGGYYYKASTDEGWELKWKPSIFMPKPACRIFLKIKNIRLERLQDINESDAIAEGAKDTLKFSELKCMKDLGQWIIPRPFSQYQFGFLSIWCNINGPENWLLNPFVWVYEFEEIEKPNDFI